MYLSYEEYKNLGGELSEAEFKKYEFDAETIVSHETFKRIENVNDETRSAVNRCILKLISIIKLRDDILNGKTVSSFSHDGLSQSYSVPNDEALKREELNIIRMHLSGRTDLNGTPLLYLGVSNYD